MTMHTKAGERFLLFSSSFFLFCFFFLHTPPLACSAEQPVDRLYWATEEYPTEYVLWDAGLPYEGGYAALDHACRQNPGRGTYTGVVQIVNSSGNLPGMKAGYCKVRIGVWPGTHLGALYNAYLYCNGVQKDILAEDMNCETQGPVLDRDANSGPPFCPTGGEAGDERRQ